MNDLAPPAPAPGGVSLLATLRSYATVVGMSGGAALLSFLTAIVLARNLTTSQFGLFSILFSAMTVLWSATNFGDSAYIRFVNARTGSRAPVTSRGSSSSKGRRSSCSPCARPPRPGSSPIS